MLQFHLIVTRLLLAFTGMPTYGYHLGPLRYPLERCPHSIHFFTRSTLLQTPVDCLQLATCSYFIPCSLSCAFLGLDSLQCLLVPSCSSTGPYIATSKCGIPRVNRGAFKTCIDSGMYRRDNENTASCRPSVLQATGRHEAIFSLYVPLIEILLPMEVRRSHHVDRNNNKKRE